MRANGTQNGSSKNLPRGDWTAVLDIGSSKVVCLVAMDDGEGGIDLQGLGVAECKGVKRGVVTDLEETSRAIDAAVRRVEQQIGEKIESLITGVTGTHLEGHNAMGFVPIYPRSRQITREDVLQVINHSRQFMIPPDREMIQALPREFKIDGQRGVQRPIGMNGSKLEVTTYIVTGQTTHIQNIEKATQMTGRRVDQMVVTSLASGLGVLTPDEIELGAVVVDIGEGVTDIGVFQGGSIAYSATIPIGSGLVTSDISKLLRCSPDEAERLKVMHAHATSAGVDERDSVQVIQLGHDEPRALQRKVLCEITESRMRELAVMVRQQIEKSGLYAMLPGGVVLTGGGALLSGSEKLFTEVLKHLRVRHAEPRLYAGHGMDTDRSGLATAAGIARFAIQCFDDELGPASGSGGWKERIRTIFSLISGKA
ncbi:MAG: cell division protein FtsA [Armatimonadetes bacterium 55-13]|nr:cell division protein FtsA [Armatimonadota bacterium]OJU64808.1 MAG: cell division protein FtsA [Armatimonadetes bacterium 55-13]